MKTEIFKKTGKNILGYLRKLGGMSNVYSARRQGLEPLLSDKDAYIYATEEEIPTSPLPSTVSAHSSTHAPPPKNGKKIWTTLSKNSESKKPDKLNPHMAENALWGFLLYHRKIQNICKSFVYSGNNSYLCTK